MIHSNTATAGGLNYGRYSNPAVDGLIEQAAADSDEPARLREMRDTFKLEKEDIGNIPLFQQPLTWASARGSTCTRRPTIRSACI